MSERKITPSIQRDPLPVRRGGGDTLTDYSASDLASWCPDIPISELQIGDHVRALVNCKKQRPGVNYHNRQARNGTVKEIIGNIVRIQCRIGSNVAVNIRDIQKAWGYRKNLNTQ